MLHIKDFLEELSRQCWSGSSVPRNDLKVVLLSIQLQIILSFPGYIIAVLLFEVEHEASETLQGPSILILNRKYSNYAICPRYYAYEQI